MGEALMIKVPEQAYKPSRETLSAAMVGYYNCYGRYWSTPFSFSCSVLPQKYSYVSVTFTYNTYSSGPSSFSIPVAGSRKDEYLATEDNGCGAYFDITFNFTGFTLSATCVLNRLYTSNGTAPLNHIGMSVFAFN